jgi:hypothetical protein
VLPILGIVGPSICAIIHYGVLKLALGSAIYGLYSERTASGDDGRVRALTFVAFPHRVPCSVSPSSHMLNTVEQVGLRSYSAFLHPHYLRR